MMSETTTLVAPPAPLVDIKTFWRTLAERAIGITIVTTHGDNGPAGLLGLSASHVAADPPTILVSIDQKMSALGAILARRHFGVSYLPAGAEAVSDAFSDKVGVSGADRLVLSGLAPASIALRFQTDDDVPSRDFQDGQHRHGPAEKLESAAIDRGSCCLPGCWAGS
jgi:flavin reductase (DIM6/NTAB) family NADH-FMN oxidoreductase RutF